MTRTRRPRVVAALAALAVALTACGGGGDAGGSSRSGAGGGEPQRGGTVTWINAVEPSDLRPVSITGTPNIDGQHALALYDALVVETWDGGLEYRIAESMESDDGMVWTLTLRPDVEFSDGTPYDAEAVQYNWEQIAEPENAAQNLAAAERIASMEVVDPLTLRIRLRAADSQWPRTVAEKLAFVASPTALQASGDFNDNPVGAGPFLLEEWVRGSNMRLVRNPGYWDAPRPYLDELDFRVVPDCNQQASTLTTTNDSFVTSHTCPSLEEDAEAAGLQTQRDLPPVGSLSLAFNTARPPFDDVRARRAIVQALDFDQHAETVGRGVAHRPESIARPDSPWYDDEAVQLGHDAEEAQRLLDELADETGEPLRFTLSGTQNTAQSLDLFVSQLGAYDNVVVSTDITTSSEYGPLLARREFDAGMLSAFGTDPVPQFVDYFSSDSERNWTSYSNPEVDDALATLTASFDQDERAEAFSTVQRNLVEDVPMYFHIERPINTAYHESIHELGSVTTGNRWDTMWLGSGG